MVKNLPANAGDAGSTTGSGRSLGGGNGNPLQYRCLENPMDRGAWQATVYGVAKSWIQLGDWACTHQEMSLRESEVKSEHIHIWPNIYEEGFPKQEEGKRVENGPGRTNVQHPSKSSIQKRVVRGTSATIHWINRLISTGPPYEKPPSKDYNWQWLIKSYLDSQQ